MRQKSKRVMIKSVTAAFQSQTQHHVLFTCRLLISSNRVCIAIQTQFTTIKMQPDVVQLCSRSLIWCFKFSFGIQWILKNLTLWSLGSKMESDTFVHLENPTPVCRDGST